MSMNVKMQLMTAIEMPTAQIEQVLTTVPVMMDMREMVSTAQVNMLIYLLTIHFYFQFDSIKDDLFSTRYTDIKNKGD